MGIGAVFPGRALYVLAALAELAAVFWIVPFNRIDGPILSYSPRTVPL